MQMRVLVIGLGAFGVWFSRTMREMGHEVIAIERDGDLVDRHAEWLSRAVVGDATDPALLERLAVSGVDAAVITTGEDLSTTILAIMALRDLGVRVVYAKARSVNAARALDRLDVTEAVFPERDAGSRLAHRIVSRAVLDYTPIGEGFSMQEIAVPDAWTGRSLVEIEPRESLGLQVVGVRDALTGELTLPPDPAAKLKTSDSLLIAGRDDVLEELGSRAAARKREG
jgi:trk system potassium uptake protein TrkA